MLVSVCTHLLLAGFLSPQGELTSRFPADAISPSMIEVRDAFSGRLCQVITGSQIQLAYDGSAISSGALDSRSPPPSATASIASGKAGGYAANSEEHPDKRLHVSMKQGAFVSNQSAIQTTLVPVLTLIVLFVFVSVAHLVRDRAPVSKLQALLLSSLSVSCPRLLGPTGFSVPRAVSVVSAFRGGPSPSWSSCSSVA